MAITTEQKVSGAKDSFLSNQPIASDVDQSNKLSEKVLEVAEQEIVEMPDAQPEQPLVDEQATNEPVLAQETVTNEPVVAEAVKPAEPVEDLAF